MSLLMEALRKADGSRRGERSGSDDPTGSHDPKTIRGAAAGQAEMPSSAEPDSLLVLDLEHEESGDAGSRPGLEPAGLDAEEVVSEPVSRNRRRDDPKPADRAAQRGKSDSAAATEAADAPQMAKMLVQASHRRRRITRLLMGLVLLGLLAVAAMGSWYFSNYSANVAAPPAMQAEANADFDASQDSNSIAARNAGAGEGNAVEGEEQVQVAELGAVAEPNSEKPKTPLPAGATNARAQREDGKSVHPAISRKTVASTEVTPPAAARHASATASQDDTQPPATAREAYGRALEQASSEETPRHRIEIRKGRKKKPEAKVAREAWQAFRQGHYREARHLYATLLKRSPRDRNALLGMAATAVALGEPKKAQEFYLRLLERDPRDAAAVAGMISLQGSVDVPETIARIRTLIASNPELDALNFVLGNLYAAQQRWAYAQQAYFDAYSAYPDNPDYAFNLAVSLDHLGKYRQALDYYRRALLNANGRKVGFSVAPLRKRIAALEQASGAK